MPAYCAIIGCTSKGYSTGRKFSSFPMLNNRNAKSLALTQARQSAWIRAINRSDFFASQFQHARVCDLHFISGKASKYTDVNNPDWVPTLRLGFEEEHLDEEYLDEAVQVETSNEMDDQSSIEIDTAVEISNEMNDESFIELETVRRINNDKVTQTFVSTADVGTQTDGTITGMSPDIVFSYIEQIKMLEEMLVIHNVTLEDFRGNDKKTNFFTGISHFATLEALFDMVESKIGFSRKLSKFQILIIVLSRLRLNLSFRYLSYQFNVTIPTISRHFYNCLGVLYKKLKKIVYWPSRDAIQKTMPLCFKRCFGDSITVIIDCFEIYIERPGNQKALIQVYSSYKHAYTLKYLIGITPQGFIAFISEGYGGRCSDKFVTDHCGFLDKIELDDTVMADRGFLIEEELKVRGVELNIPAFTKGKTQLHRREIESTRKIANVRIHVERVIGQLRQKFTVLHQFKFPISLIKRTNSSVNVIDQILTVCSALSNLCDPIVCKASDEAH